MNRYIDTEIILQRKIEPFIYVYIMIIIVIMLSLIILSITYHYKTYYKIKGIVTKEEDYYIRIYMPLKDINYLVNNDYIIINNNKYKYNIISLEEEYFQNELNTYQIVKISIELPNNYKHNNLTLDLKLLKEDKRIIDYIIKR